MRLLTIAELRTRIGLLATDVTKDAELIQCYDIALSLIEDYLDRKVLQSTYKETFYETRTALVKAWPIVSITTVDGVAPDASLDVDLERGIIRNVNWAKKQVEYIGGWLDADIPMAITLAINQVFDNVWTSSPGFGLTQATAAAVGTVKKFTINGVTVEYVTDASNTSASGSSSGEYGLIPTITRGFLDRYRRESVIGVG